MKGGFIVNRFTKRAIIAGGIVAGISAGLLLLAGQYYVNVAIKRGKKKYSNEKRRKNNTDENKERSLGKIFAEYRKMLKSSKELMESIPKEEMTISSDDGLTLYGELFRNPGSHKYVLIAHGYNCSLSEMYCYLSEFYQKGFNVLFTDLRAHGKSEGEYIGMGWLERNDIKKWCEHLSYLDPNSSILLFGQSMGAAAVMMACGENLPDNVKACVEDSGYASVGGMYKTLMKEAYHIPSFPLLNVADFVARCKAGYSFLKADTCKQLQKSSIPTLFIHAEGDSYVPFGNVQILYDSANEPKEMYTVPGGEHVCACFCDKDAYFNKIFDFADKYMN